MAGKLSIDARIWFNLDDLLCFLFLVSVREVSVPADQPAPRRDEEMHHDSYELISCSDGALSTQIKYLPTSFKSHLSKRKKKNTIAWKNKMECTFLPTKKIGLFICECELSLMSCLVTWVPVRSLCCRALRRAYMQSGGSDPAIVARMIDLQAEAKSLEKTQPASSGKSKTQGDAGQKICTASCCITQHSCAQWSL